MSKMSILLVIYLLFLGSLAAQVNPFLSSTPQEDTIEGTGNTVAERTAPVDVKTQSIFSARSAAVQRKLQRQITSLLSNTNSAKGLLFMLGLSFLYGVLHALGPGHRKTIIVGYFLGEKVRPVAGVGTGLLLAFEHGGSAIFLVGGLTWLSAKSLTLSMNTAEVIMLPISYSIIIMLGIWMILQGYLDYRWEREGNARHVMGTAGMLLSGLIPCPAATAIMIFSISMGYLKTGVLSVIAMSLGMGALLSCIGLTAIIFRERISRIITNRSSVRYLELVFHWGSGLLLVFIGGVFLLQVLPG